jgi:hypothetical protein
MGGWWKWGEIGAFTSGSLCTIIQNEVAFFGEGGGGLRGLGVLLDEVHSEGRHAPKSSTLSPKPAGERFRTMWCTRREGSGHLHATPSTNRLSQWTLMMPYLILFPATGQSGCTFTSPTWGDWSDPGLFLILVRRGDARRYTFFR